MDMNISGIQFTPLMTEIIFRISEYLILHTEHEPFHISVLKLMYLAKSGEH